MKKTKILTIPNPILRQKAKEVGVIDGQIKQIIGRMIFAIDHEDIGLGLAAPQIGESIRAIVVKVRQTTDENGHILQKEIPTTVYINPVITKRSGEKITVEGEGCLSYPGYFGPVERHKKIRFEATTLDGKRAKISAGGLLSIIIQHEVDHLDGILFIDRIKDKSKIRKESNEDDGKKL